MRFFVAFSLIAYAIAAPTNSEVGSRSSSSLLMCRYGIVSPVVNSTVLATCNGQCTRVKTYLSDTVSITTYSCYSNGVCDHLGLDNGCWSPDNTAVCCCNNKDDCNGWGEKPTPPVIQPNRTIMCNQGLYLKGLKAGKLLPQACAGQCVSLHYDKDIGFNEQTTDVRTCDMTSAACDQMGLHYGGCVKFDGGYGCCCNDRDFCSDNLTPNTTMPVTTTTTTTTTTARPVGPGSCQSGWTYFAGNGYCYKSIFSVNYYTAWNECSDMGGYLTSIHNAAENAFVSEMARTNTNITQLEQMTLIGLYYLPNTDQFSWSDNTPVDYIRWAPKEPRYKTPDSCVVLSQDSPDERWYIQSCNQMERAAVCKKRP